MKCRVFRSTNARTHRLKYRHNGARLLEQSEIADWQRKILLITRGAYGPEHIYTGGEFSDQTLDLAAVHFVSDQR